MSFSPRLLTFETMNPEEVYKFTCDTEEKFEKIVQVYFGISRKEIRMKDDEGFFCRIGHYKVNGATVRFYSNDPVSNS